MKMEDHHNNKTNWENKIESYKDLEGKISQKLRKKPTENPNSKVK